MNFNFGDMFNGMFKPVANGYCKLGMNGKIAIKTSSGYKTFDIKKKTLINCNSFAFDVDGAFWVVPTFKVEEGDIIAIDIPNMKLDIKVSDEELEERRKSYVKPEPNVKSGWLARYSTLVSSAKDGAVMKKVF